jgi:polyisoprenoid-binding protein YceI
MRQIMRQLRITSLLFVAVLAPSQHSLAAEHPVDLQHSTIRIHVGKAGLFSAAGHEHWVSAPIASGAVEEDEPQHIFFTVQAKSLTVEPDKDLKPEQQAEVQRTMQDKVLESAQYPEISFRSSSVEKAGADTFVVKGDLALHGQVHPVSATVHRQGKAYVGTSRFKQTTFCIHPVNVGGVVKVKDELEIQFSVVPAPGETE